MVGRALLLWWTDTLCNGGMTSLEEEDQRVISQVNKSWWLIAIHWLILANDSHFYFFYSFPFLLVTAKLSLRRHQNCNDTKRYKYQIKLKIIWIDELNKMLVLIKCFFKNVNLSTEGLRSYAVWLVDPPFQLLATCTRCYQWSSSWFFFFFRFNNFKRNNIKYIIKYF